MKSKKSSCRKCKWYLLANKEDGYICTNEASRYFAKWTKSTTFCKSWEDSSNTKS